MAIPKLKMDATSGVASRQQLEGRRIQAEKELQEAEKAQKESQSLQVRAPITIQFPHCSMGFIDDLKHIDPGIN